MIYIVNLVKHLGPNQVQRTQLAKVSFDNGQFTVIEDNGLGREIEAMPLPRAERYLNHLANSQSVEVIKSSV